jgi:CheY-like chemotaxis protein
MTIGHLDILLADDDLDDCIFFKDALDELDIQTNLVYVHDGEELLEYLQKKKPLPDLLFLDLNMPRKNGYECLLKIKENEKLKYIPVIIYSTSFESEIVNLLFKNGAHFYFRKPADFAELKKVIDHVLNLFITKDIPQPGKENFIVKTGRANEIR